MDKKMMIRISNVLHDLGIPTGLKGYRCLMNAIGLGLEDPKALEQITKGLYPKVAKIMDTTPARVERAIRHAIEVSWDRGDIQVLYEYFGNSVSGLKGKPTNGECIATLVEWIQLERDLKPYARS